MSFDYDKLRDAIHYICSLNTEVDGTLDDIKLNKVLWYSDAMAYMLRGQSITGATYIRKKHGPVARAKAKAVQSLLDDEFIVEGKRYDDSGSWKNVLDSTKSANKKAFSESERLIIEQIYDYLNSSKTAMEISEQSHGYIWMLARENETIPLFTMFAENARFPNEAEFQDAVAA